MKWLFITKFPKEGEKRKPDQQMIRNLVYGFIGQREHALKTDADLIAEFIDWLHDQPEPEDINFDVPKLSPSHHADSVQAPDA